MLKRTSLIFLLFYLKIMNNGTSVLLLFILVLFFSTVYVVKLVTCYVMCIYISHFFLVLVFIVWVVSECVCGEGSSLFTRVSGFHFHVYI